MEIVSNKVKSPPEPFWSAGLVMSGFLPVPLRHRPGHARQGRTHTYAPAAGTRNGPDNARNRRGTRKHSEKSYAQQHRRASAVAFGYPTSDPSDGEPTFHDRHHPGSRNQRHGSQRGARRAARAR